VSFSRERVVPVLLFVLIGTAMIATLPQMRSAWEGAKLGAHEDAGLRWLREAVLLLIMGWVVLERRFWQVLLSNPVAPLLLWLGGYATFEVLYACYLGLPLIVPMVGLRTFQYLPLVLVGMMMARMDADGERFAEFARYLRWFVLIEALVAAAQVLSAPPLHGVSVLGGSRAFGTFVAPNHYGVAMATCALVFAMVRRRGSGKWIYLSALLALLSGSRTAILEAGLVLGFRAYHRCPRKHRVLVLMMTPVLAGLALVLVSSKAISGRDIELEDEGRLVLWSELLGGSIDSVADLLFGWGLGLGSSSVFTLFGEDAFPGQFVSDGLYLFLLSSFGVIGLVFYLSILLGAWGCSKHAYRGLFFSFLLLAGLPFNAFEYFPQNALLMFLWGYVASVKVEQPCAPQATGYGSLAIPGPGASAEPVCAALMSRR
jgi:hypothetical protein